MFTPIVIKYSSSLVERKTQSKSTLSINFDEFGLKVHNGKIQDPKSNPYLTQKYDATGATDEYRTISSDAEMVKFVKRIYHALNILEPYLINKFLEIDGNYKPQQISIDTINITNLFNLAQQPFIMNLLHFICNMADVANNNMVEVDKAVEESQNIFSKFSSAFQKLMKKKEKFDEFVKSTKNTNISIEKTQKFFKTLENFINAICESIETAEASKRNSKELDGQILNLKKIHNVYSNIFQNLHNYLGFYGFISRSNKYIINNANQYPKALVTMKEMQSKNAKNNKTMWVVGGSMFLAGLAPYAKERIKSNKVTIKSNKGVNESTYHTTFEDGQEVKGTTYDFRNVESSYGDSVFGILTDN